MSKIRFIIFTLKVSLTTSYATIKCGGEKVTYQFKWSYKWNLNCVTLNITTLTPYFYLPEGRSSACLTSIRIWFRLKLINLSNTNRIRGPNRFYILLYTFLIMHGLGRLVQSPLTHYYLLGPLILFVLDKLMSLSRNQMRFSLTVFKLFVVVPYYS
jgi:hypothetical protein